MPRFFATAATVPFLKLLLEEPLAVSILPPPTSLLTDQSLRLGGVADLHGSDAS
jgi:hypothetical protein